MNRMNYQGDSAPPETPPRRVEAQQRPKVPFAPGPPLLQERDERIKSAERVKQKGT